MTDSHKRHIVYESAVDTWVAFLLALSPVVSVVIGIWLWIQGQADSASIMFVSGAFVTIVTVVLTLPCRYTLLEDAVSVRCGLMLFYQIPYSDLVSVEPSSTWISGPALSMKRVELKTEKRTIIVSPKDREKFIEQVIKRMNKSME